MEAYAIKKLYKFVVDNDIDGFNQELKRINIIEPFVANMIKAIHKVWSCPMDPNEKDIDVIVATLCEYAIKKDDIEMITTKRMLDNLWCMFYISGDVKYPNMIKRIAESSTHDTDVINAAFMSYMLYDKCPNIRDVVKEEEPKACL